jgi:hypothetical protein
MRDGRASEDDTAVELRRRRESGVVLRSADPPR